MSSIGSSLASTLMGLQLHSGFAAPLLQPHGPVRGASAAAGSRDCAFPALGHARAASLHVSPTNPGLDVAAIERLFLCVLCVNSDE